MPLDGTVLNIQTPRPFIPLLAPRRYKLARGGRASGKSHNFGEMLIERALVKRTRWLCIREHQTTLRNSVKQLLEDKINKFGVAREFRILNNSIEGPNNSTFNFIGMKNHTAESVKSFEDYDGAWGEEAQTFTQKSLDILVPTIRKEGSEIWMSWNQRYATDPIEAFANQHKNDRDVCLVDVNWRMNPWLSTTTIKDIIRDKRRDPERYAHIWEGKYDTKSNAKVFSNFRIGELSEFEKLGNLPSVYGSDFGFANDPAGIVHLKVDVPNKIIYVVSEAFGVGVEIDNIGPRLYAPVVADPRNAYIIADSARPETISYLKRNGYPLIRGAKKGPNSVKEGVEFIRSYDVVIHPSCQVTFDEFTHYSYKVDPHTDLVQRDLEDKKNHAIDSVRYALERIRKPKAGWI